MSEKEASVDALRQLVCFVIEGETYGVDILQVQEIIRPVAITRVPRAPVFVEGVINLRGRIVPVVDLRTRFGLAPRARDKDTRIIVVDLGGKVVGFLVDAVREVLRIAANRVEAPPELAVGLDARYITGVARLDDALLILLDLDEVLTEGEHEQLASQAA